MDKRERGRPYKEIYINVKEFIDMVAFIRDHPVDRLKFEYKEDDVPIPETGKSYWKQALNQVIDCLIYIDKATPLTSAKMVKHEKKLARYSDDRLAIYEYIRTEIIEKNGGNSKIYDK